MPALLTRTSMRPSSRPESNNQSLYRTQGGSKPYGFVGVPYRGTRRRPKRRARSEQRLTRRAGAGRVASGGRRRCLVFARGLVISHEFFVGGDSSSANGAHQSRRVAVRTHPAETPRTPPLSPGPLNQGGGIPWSLLVRHPAPEGAGVIRAAQPSRRRTLTPGTAGATPPPLRPAPLAVGTHVRYSGRPWSGATSWTASGAAW
jgi:hypothetical protein